MLDFGGRSGIIVDSYPAKIARSVLFNSTTTAYFRSAALLAIVNFWPLAGFRKSYCWERFALRDGIMAARKSTGKRLRFEIFKRDGFTCQYCGNQPPEVVLVIDHIFPVAKGGDNDPMNLVTACEICNQGKADKTLGSISPRPDADLEWLETQQEIAELRRYQIAKVERDEIREEITESLVKTFELISHFTWKTEMIRDKIRAMLTQCIPEDVETAITASARKVASERLDRYEWDRYAWGVLRNINKERKEE